MIFLKVTLRKRLNANEKLKQKAMKHLTPLKNEAMKCLTLHYLALLRCCINTGSDPICSKPI
jgi:hypothetical protein